MLGGTQVLFFLPPFFFKKKYCLFWSHSELTRSRAVALNFCSKNALGSIWPGGFPIPIMKIMTFSECKKFPRESGRMFCIDLGSQTNQFLAEGTLCSLENDKSHSSTCYKKMSTMRSKITPDNPLFLT